MRGVVTDARRRSRTARRCSRPAAARHCGADDESWGAIGAGSVLAHAAGADLADLELCQFHPTALALPGPPRRRAVTEAVRGEGATLLDAAGRRFTDELAPRDQVSAAILDRMDADGSDHVLLDLRGLDPVRFASVLRPAGTRAWTRGASRCRSRRPRTT